MNLILLFGLCFGLIIGSFLNVVVYRMPRLMPLGLERSACPHCNFKIPWYLNIPVLSFIFIGGRCYNCRSKISLEYPLVELFTGIVFVFLFNIYYFDQNLTRLMMNISAVSAFIAIFLIDIKHRIIPDEINIFLAIVFLINAYLSHSLKTSLLGMTIGFCITYGVTYLFYKLRGEIGLGGGDIKLFAVLGILFGPVGIIQNITISCLLGAVFGSLFLIFSKKAKDTPIPFGPFIILSASIQIFYPGILSKIFS